MVKTIDVLQEIREHLKDNTKELKNFNNRQFWLIVGLIGLVAGKEILIPAIAG